MAVSIATAIIYDNGWKYQKFSVSLPPLLHLSPVHPRQGSSPPTQGVTAEAKGGPGQEVTPGDEVEEEEVHHDPAYNQSQHDGQP